MVAKSTSDLLTTRQRLISGAAELTAREGWANVTMAGLATYVGVSRQTVYNEFGSRAEVAEAMVMSELLEFLGEVDAGFDAQPIDLIAALTEASSRVLKFASLNPLLRAIVTATHTGETELLPLLTTRADAVIDAARQALMTRVVEYPLRPDAPIEAVCDAIVRIVLSHVMQPAGPSVEVAVTWLAAPLLPTHP